MDRLNLDFIMSKLNVVYCVPNFNRIKITIVIKNLALEKNQQQHLMRTNSNFVVVFFVFVLHTVQSNIQRPLADFYPIAESLTDCQSHKIKTNSISYIVFLLSFRFCLFVITNK